MWLPLVIVAVVAVAAFAVDRVHNSFGADKRPQYTDTKLDEATAFDPKKMVYEVFGEPGATANISYFDAEADPQWVPDAPLPWRLEIVSTAPALMGNIVAQGDGDTLGCRITVDGDVKSERVSKEVSAYTYCVIKAA